MKNSISQIPGITKRLWKSDASKGQRLRVSFRYLWAHIRFLFQKRFIFNWVDGIRLWAVQHRHSSTECYYFGKYDPDEMSFLEQYLRKGEVFLDVGANIGSYSLLAASTGAEAIAIEPCPSTYMLMEENIGLNGRLKKLINPVMAAVGEQDGEVYFSTDDDTTNRVLSEDEIKTVPHTKVKSHRLDDICNVCDAMKLDVENYEVPALRGGAKLLANSRLNIIIAESFGNESEVYSLLKGYGFKMYGYDEIKRKLYPSNGRTDGNNVIYVRDVGIVEERLKTHNE